MGTKRGIYSLRGNREDKPSPSRKHKVSKELRATRRSEELSPALIPVEGENLQPASTERCAAWTIAAGEKQKWSCQKHVVSYEVETQEWWCKRPLVTKMYSNDINIPENLRAVLPKLHQRLPKIQFYPQASCCV